MIQPLVDAAADGKEEEVARLLATGAAEDEVGVRRALQQATLMGHVRVVQLLVQAAPEAAAATDEGGRTPLHFAAGGQTDAHAELVQLLFKAAPAAALAVASDGCTPLHRAASVPNSATVRLLLAAAPAAADRQNNNGQTPLGQCLWMSYTAQRAAADECAHLLIAAAPAAQPTLSTLVGYPDGLKTAHLLPGLVAHLPLTEAEWCSIPAPWPQLASVLPAVLQRSTAEAGWLVGRLAAEQKDWLRAAVLCLNSAALPAELAHRILALCLASG